LARVAAFSRSALEARPGVPGSDGDASPDGWFVTSHPAGGPFRSSDFWIQKVFRPSALPVRSPRSASRRRSGDSSDVSPWICPQSR